MSGDGRLKPADARPVLITGGAGFIGCNIADRLAEEGQTDRFASDPEHRGLYLPQGPAAAAKVA